MSMDASRAPIDPARHRATIAQIYAAFPQHRQADALRLVEDWPRLIHFLANAGELTHPITPKLEQAA